MAVFLREIEFMLDRRWLLAPWLALAAILGAANLAVAGVLDATWTAPTTNTDGSQLTDLSFYRVYFGTSTTPCPGGTFVTVPSPNPAPPPGQTVSTRLTGLTNNTVYNVSVDAVDTSGNASTCSAVANATAAPDVTVTPTTAVAFGNVNIGSFAEQTFIVQSNRAGVTGTASVAAPFTIASGSPFNLSTAGATQTVTVRFVPTNTTLQSVNVNFVADGDSISRLVTGTGVPIGPTLTVSKSGAGSGTVSSSPAGINCGASCSTSYVIGTQVTLTATPAAGSTFTGWTGGGCAGTGTCVVTMNADTTVTAGFVVQSFALTVNRSGNGTGTVTSAPTGINCGATCSTSFSFGTQVTLTASAATGSTFTGWSGGSCSGTGTCVVTINAATTVTANFTVPTFLLTVTKAGAGSGTVTSTPAGINCGPSCSVSFNINTMVTLTATPVAGSTFMNWTGACTGAGGCTVTMSAARAVTANFGVSTVTFTDNPLVAQATVVKVIHAAELRTTIAMARARNGLAAFTWSDTLTAATTQIKAVHITEMRTAINQIYQALGRTVPTYTDPTLVAGQTTAKAAHVQELRSAVSALP
jgi:List-Bact-rpt repeat protein